MDSDIERITKKLQACENQIVNDVADRILAMIASSGEGFETTLIALPGMLKSAVVMHVHPDVFDAVREKTNAYEKPTKRTAQDFYDAEIDENFYITFRPMADIGIHKW